MKTYVQQLQLSQMEGGRQTLEVLSRNYKQFFIELENLKKIMFFEILKGIWNLP